MKKHYLLIVNDTWNENGSPIFALDAALHRMSRGLWNLYENTPHRKNITTGDEVLIYIAGNGPYGKSFIGRACIAGITVDKTDIQGLYGEPPFAAIKLINTALFINFIPISAIKEKLDFVPKNNPKWGCVMQRGLKYITEKDFLTILNIQLPPINPIKNKSSESGF